MKQKVIIRKKQLALVVSAACLAMGSASAQQQVNSDILISGYTEYSQVNLDQGQNIVVDMSGQVQVEPGVGVNVDTGITAGSITNNGGTIVGYGGGIAVSGSVNGISNSSGGIITGGVSAYGGYLNSAANGITVAGGTVAGDISNSSGGVISGANVGMAIFDSHVSGSIVNIGSITEAQTYIDYGAVGGGVVVNHSAIDGDFNNNGEIYSNTTHGLEITNNATIGGQLINGVDGLIESYSGDAIHLGSGSIITGGVVNDGRLFTYGGFDDKAGLRLDGATISNGGITNNGNIEGGAGSGSGITVANSTITGNIINNGTIEGFFASTGTGINITDASQINGDITNTGRINASSNGILVASGSTVSGNITNTGSIEGGEGSGNGIAVTNGIVTGNIVNTGAIEGGEGYSFYAGGNIGTGIRVSDGSQVNGAIINGSGGMIQATYDAILVDASTVGNGIVNAGTLIGASGITVQSQSVIGSGGIVNSAGGLISADNGGIAVLSSQINGSITNAGTVNASNGILVTSGSVITGDILNSGTISILGSTDNSGIAISGSGTVINGSIINTGLISAADPYGDGGGYGITVRDNSRVTGTISNSGTIQSLWSGIDVVGSTVGSVVNDSSGAIISSSTHGVSVYNSTLDGISNLGQISAWEHGIVVDTSTVNGDVHNASGGVINGGWTGMYVTDSTVNGSVLNDGTISSRSDGIDIGTSIVTGELRNTGTINAGGEGWGTGISLYDATITGKIVNAGTIQNNGYGNGIDMYGGSAARIVNGSAGVISAAFGSGIYVDSGSSGAVLSNGILNQGQISGTQFGIEIHNSSIVAGGIVNDTSAKITGGILADNSQIGGGITNRGTITGSTYDGGEGYTGGDGIAVTNQTTVTGNINNSGTINADGAGIRVDNSIVTGKIVNSGTINGGNGSYYGDYSNGQYGGGIAVTHGSVVDSIDNKATGIITANNASNYYGGSVGGITVYNSTVNNGISNEGTISGVGGIIVSDATIGAHGIVNATTGNIQGALYGVGIGNAHITGDIVNHGTIEGAEGIGLYMIGEGNALVDSATNTVDGSIINDGSISGAYAGVVIQGTAISGSIENSSQIQSAYGSAISLSGSTVDSVTNHAGATIEGGEGLSLSYSSVNGAITNAGSITSASGNAMQLFASTADRIVNTATGVISATNGSGIYLDGGEGSSGSVLSHGILNQGQISGTRYGIEMYSTAINAGGIVNDTGATTSGGILVSSSQITGGILNHGAIIGTEAQSNASPMGIMSIGGGSSGNGNGITLSNGTIVNGNIVNTGTITAPNAGILIDGSTLNGAIENSGTIAGAKAIDIVDPATAVTINNSGLLAGGVSIANGVLNLNGTNSRVTGAVDGTGTVNVKGTFTSENTFNVGTFNIDSGARFNANNNVTATSGMSNSGTLSVLAIRPFTMTGDYNQTTSGVYHIDANSMTSYGQMTVTGTATLAPKANIDVDVTGVEKLTPNGTLAGVIKAGTLNASTFNVTDNSALFNFEGVINGSNVDLTVRNAITVYSSTVQNSNFPGGNAAQVLDTLFQSNSNADSDVGNVMTAFGKLATTKEVSEAVNQTLPLFTGAAAAASSGAVSTTSRVVQARQDTNLGLSAGDGFITDRQMWAKPFGSWAKQGNRDGVFGYSASTGGVVFGADGVVSKDDRIGAAFAYANTNVDGNNEVAPQSAKVNTYMAMVYGSHSLDQRTDLSWQAEVGTNQVDAGRTINFGGLDRRANSSFHGVNTHLGLSLGRVMEVNETTNFVPSLRLDYTMIKNNGYTETGAGALNLNVADQRTQSMVLGVDGKIVHKLSDKSTFTANLGAGYDLMSKQNSITTAYVGGGAAFSTAGIEPSAWSVRGGAGVILHQGTGTEITARYDVDAQRSFTNQTVSVKLRKAF